MWEWFLELNAGRATNGFGMLPIAYAEIDAFSRLTDAQLAPWEVRALRAMDGAYLEAMNG